VTGCCSCIKPVAAGMCTQSRRERRSVVMAMELGRRYVCEVCGTEVLCTKPGSGGLQCCGKEMGLKQAKPLPSSD
jgi:Desulfoferrodoxin, N-terminal domain